MRHAGRDALAALEDVVQALRATDGLRESRPGAFAVSGKAFCHFHEDGERYFVDVRLEADGDFERREVTTAAQRRRFVTDARRAVRRRATAGSR